MKSGFSLYDTHTHIGAARHSGRTFTAEQMLAVMDRTGVDRALLIPFPVVEDFRAEHDLIARAVKQYPDRFAGAACLPPFIALEEFQGEVKRCREELGFVALKLQPMYHGINPLSVRHDFFFEAALANHLPVIVHTGAGAPLALPSLYIMTARKFPELRIVLGHAGGGIYTGEAIVAATVCPNIYIEVSTIAPHHLMEVLDHIPSSRIMAGSDLPESMESEMAKALTLPISDEAKRDVSWNTAQRLFHGKVS